MTDDPVADLDAVLGRLLGPALAGLAAQLGSIGDLTDPERTAVWDGVAAGLRETARRKAARVLLLELHAARVTGRLTAADSEGHWREWIAQASQPGWWDSLAEPYPVLTPRLRTLIDNRCRAGLRLARRFAADRHTLAPLTAVDVATAGTATAGVTAGDNAAQGLGALTEVRIGAGDSHRGGETVAILRCAGGKVVYKPRSLAVDAALARLLDRLLPDRPADVRIRAPRVVERGGHGWAEHIDHRYCADDRELADFYRGIGHWLAVMRLVGGSDLHAENLIAAGAVPVVVDCETLFTPHPAPQPSGYGHALDLAADLVAGSVLRTGLLPGRGLALGWRGVDASAVGSLPGQQPTAELPVIVDAGTDRARYGTEPIPVGSAANHPSPEPVLGRHWDQVVTGFAELTERMAELDRDGRLEALLAEFAGCQVRVVPRATEVYAELSRMLWHPVSLHDERSAARRAADLLARQAAHTRAAPGDPAVIEAEIAELLHGDVPFFAASAGSGRLRGPRGTTWEVADSLVRHALRRWREADFGLDRRVIQATLVSAYLNEGWLPDEKPLVPAVVRADDLDRRRRAIAAGILRRMCQEAVRGHDGTVTWVAPVLNPTGWAVQPLSPDCYGGLSGVAIVLAGYASEARNGRADPVPGVDDLLDRVLRSLRVGEARWEAEQVDGVRQRPEPPGGYIGISSRIFGWLLLERLAPLAGEGVVRARALAGQLPEPIAADEAYDIQTGMAGAVAPLLALARRTGERAWADLAHDIGRRLSGAARLDARGARWQTPQFPDGVGGFAHGATGVGWALTRLGEVTGSTEFADLAEAAFRFEESLYEETLGGWRDLREPDRTASAWCHGAGGVGLVAADLAHRGACLDVPGVRRDAGRRAGRAAQPGDAARWRDVLRRAAAACWSDGLGWNHTLCHGDLGAWEVLDAALTAGVGPSGLDRAALDSRVISGVEEHGPVSGMARDVFAPGLLPGLGGVAYQLLRMHPECRLPSVLLPDPDPAAAEPAAPAAAAPATPGTPAAPIVPAGRGAPGERPAS